MRTLFISGLNENNGGGSVISNRNKQLLCDLLGETNVYEYRIAKKRNTLKTVFERCAFAYVVGLDSKAVKEILEIAKKMDIIWIDGSFYGVLAKELKDNGYRGRIITFFHNIEKFFRKRTLIESILYPLYNGPLVRSEKDAINYSDILIALTDRDAAYMYKIRPDAHVVLLPSSMKDTFVDKDGYAQRASRSTGMLNLLFVGSYFYANINGISWFIDKVLPFVNARLTVVGANMDKLPYVNTDKLQIHGFVKDLGEYYRRNDAVIAPIFEGSGMKTKTTEALMWGKYIIGTDESFCGFLMDSSVGTKCRTENDFIECINTLSEHGLNRFNIPSRDLYKKNYSMEHSMDIIKKVIYDF